MATCKDCLHIAMCYLIEHYGEDADEEGVETYCSSFADRSKYVVREKGEWVPVLNGGGQQCEEEIFASVWRCPVCGEENFHSNFCPDCGSDMRKGDV